MQIQVKHEFRIITGTINDVSKTHLERALKRYDSQLYLKWDSKKAVWQLRRRPDTKSVKEGYFLDVPSKGRVFFPGDVHEFDNFTISVPKYHETRADCVKIFQHLDYRILDWVAKQDLWKYGYKGKNFADEAAYREAKFEEKIDEDSYAEKAYGLKQMRTQINDFRQYVLDGGDPYRLLDFWK